MSAPEHVQAPRPDGRVTVVLATENGQSLTVVRDAHSGAATLRVAKDGHNRAVAKLSADTVDALVAFLAPLTGGAL